MKRLKLKAETRKILGKKVKKLRKEGILPANVYGKKIKSQALKLKLADFQKVYEEVGETGLIDLLIDQEKKTRAVLIHNPQVDPLTSDFLHADFHQVELKEKLKAEIPLVISGEAPAVLQKQGLLIQPLNSLKIEALPTDLPDEIKVDISGLAEVDQEIKVRDLVVGKKIAVLTDKNIVVAKIGSLEEEVAEKEEKAPAEEEKEEEKKEEKRPEEKPNEEEKKT